MWIQNYLQLIDVITKLKDPFSMDGYDAIRPLAKSTQVNKESFRK